MNLLTIDHDKCIKCGICAEVCPSCILKMDEDGPICIWERGCMNCGHCVAVCPTKAFNNSRCPLEEQENIDMPVLNSEVAYKFLRMRRSIRTFKPELVETAKLRQLLDVARYAPTAGNSQGLYYLVISDPVKIRRIADITAEWMKLKAEENSLHSKYFTVVLKAYYERKQDIIARNAPHLVFALARKLNLTGISNCEQTWAYAELFAPTIGLGTTIAGFIQTCGQDGYQPLLEILEVPKKQQIVGTLMVGYPKYKYQRLVARQHLKVEFK